MMDIGFEARFETRLYKIFFSFSCFYFVSTLEKNVIQADTGFIQTHIKSPKVSRKEGETTK